MTLPGSYSATIVLLMLSLLCWGCWANAFKATGKWRFELFYFDFAIGVFIAALISALTFGTLGLDGFSVIDELQLAGKRQDAFALLAGVTFNLANMLILGAVSIAGMAVAFPAAMGVALIAGVIASYVMHPGDSQLRLGIGCVSALGAVVFAAIASRDYAARKSELAKQAAAAQPPVPAGKAKPGPRKSSSGKGILLALIGGVLAGLFYPVVELAKAGENGLGPYTLGLIIASGVLFSTFLFNLFFMNLPVQGQPVEFGDYFQGKGANHLLGLLGGILWFTGAILSFVAARAEGRAAPGLAFSYATGHGAPIIAALCGLMVWKEFAGAEGKVRVYLAIMLVLFAAGVVVLAGALPAGIAH